jgi:hypothetical protein
MHELLGVDGLKRSLEQAMRHREHPQHALEPFALQDEVRPLSILLDGDGAHAYQLAQVIDGLSSNCLHYL